MTVKANRAEYHKQYSQLRKRKRFKAKWVGPHDDDGFVDYSTSYTITEVKSSGHYVFKNNFGVVDYAHECYFSKCDIEGK